MFHPSARTLLHALPSKDVADWQALKKIADSSRLILWAGTSVPGVRTFYRKTFGAARAGTSLSLDQIDYPSPDSLEPQDLTVPRIELQNHCGKVEHCSKRT